MLAVVGAAGRVGITRDALLAIFWPESDQERARNALSQALFVIRRQPPDGALVDGRLDVRPVETAGAGGTYTHTLTDARLFFGGNSTYFDGLYRCVNLTMTATPSP